MNDIMMINIGTGETQPSIKALSRAYKCKYCTIIKQLQRWGYCMINGEMWLRLVEAKREPDKS